MANDQGRDKDGSHNRKFLKKIQMAGSLSSGKIPTAIDFPQSSNAQHLWQRLSPLGHISNPTAFLPYRR